MDKEAIFIEKLNNMSADEQREHFFSKCEEYEWEVIFKKVIKRNRYMETIAQDKRNFHANINNEYIRQILREEYEDICGNKIVKWSIWTAFERFSGNYGDVMKVMVDTINAERR